MKPTLLLLALTSSLFAVERPPVAVPRQTSGDTAVQPTWEETLTIAVGTKDADIVGSDQRAIQAAVDHVARLGGGTVRLKAGTYGLRDVVYLQSEVHLIGERQRRDRGGMKSTPHSNGRYLDPNLFQA